MGVATILEAREIVILATGEHKAAIVRRAVEGEVDHEVAATFLQRHPNTTFYLDRAAAAGAHPRGDALAARRGRVDARPDGPRGRLALASGGQGDPQAHPARLRRAPAVVAGGAARLARRAQRRRLQRARRQDPRALEAAARPAGHLLLAPSGRRRDLDGRDPPEAGRERERDHRRLHDQRQRGGLRSRRAPPSRLPAAAGGRAAPRRGARSDALGRRVDEFLGAKHPGDVDIPEVQDAKRIIRETEAVAGIRTLGLEDGAARFLNLPFYQTGMVRKASDRPGRRRDRARAARGAGARPDLRRRRPLRSARHAPDVQGGDRAGAGRARGGRRTPARGVALPRRVAGVAGDRGRPGWCRSRRRSCGSRSRRSSSTRPRRTAPRSPGPDEREFWQRVEARNKGTAAELDRLGLAEYFAMEAYVVESRPG